MKRTIRYTISLFLLTACCVSTLHGQPHKEQKQMDTFITNLMKQMTIEEKLGQLNLVSATARTGPFASKKIQEKLKDGTGGNAFSFMGTSEFIRSRMALADSTRLKIPLLSGLDIIHGYKTIFPIPLGLSCSWDMTLIENTARVAALEASSVGYNWTFSPMVDISRDPRWGRVMEGSGEDPYLGGLIAAAMIKGYQGKDLRDKTSLLACVKHLAMYGASEAGRDYNTTDMSKLTMYQYYLPPYKAAIDAGVGSVMMSFNDIDGIPATCNTWLITDLLRKEWGFNGFVVTDYNAINELIAHGVAEDYKHAAELSLNAGVDMDMVSESMLAALKQSLEEGKVTLKQIDEACRRILETKYKMGLFDNPYRNYTPSDSNPYILSEENIRVAHEAVCKSMVLLKNDSQILPLKKDQKIALIGPLADDQREMFSAWTLRGETDNVTTLLQGLKKQHPDITYTKGTQISNHPYYLQLSNGVFDEEEQQKLVTDAVKTAREADVVVLVLGESFVMSGENKSKTDLSLPQCQRELLSELKKVGKPIVLVLLAGRPLTIEDDLPLADAVLMAWRPGTAAGDALADVLFGTYNPSGKLTMTFPRSVGQIPIYYNHKNTGRPHDPSNRRGLLAFHTQYIDSPNTPLFPFGYGLSYTTYQYGDIQLSQTHLSGNDKTLTAKIHITNTGRYAGEETVQLYLNDPVASVTRPVKELKQFQKIFLQPGQTQEVTFTLTPEDLKFFNSDLVWDWEPGKFNLYIGTDSQEVKQNEFVWTK